MNYQERLSKLGVNIYDIPHVTQFEKLNLAYHSAGQYDSDDSGLKDQVDIMCSYICYLSELLDRTATHLYNVVLKDDKHIKDI